MPTGSERYYITAGGVRTALPASFRPSEISPRAVATNLVRGRGQTEVFDLSDGLPAPAPLTLSGTITAATETALDTLLQQWHAHVRSATSYDRDGRGVRAVKGGFLLAVPKYDFDSTYAEVTISLILAHVPNSGTYF